MANLPLPFDLLYRYKSSEGIIGLNLLKKYLITNLHRDLIINSPELIILIAKDKNYLKTYTQDVLKKDFYLDGKFVCEYTADLDKHLE